MNDNTIVVNPLQGIVSVKKYPRPKWMCRHKGATLADIKNRIYFCEICNPTMGTITVIPTVPSGKRTPKPVTISPTPDSPKGFKD